MPGLTEFHAQSAIVGISECAVVCDGPASIVTYALGSCIAAAVCDPVAGIGALVHFMLPDSRLDPHKAALNPYHFADTAIPAMLGRVQRNGACLRRLAVHLAGGARVLDDTAGFDVGRRNYAAVRKSLYDCGVLVTAEAVGGEVSRTVRLEVPSGRFWVRESAGPEKELAAATWPYEGAKREFR